MQKFLNFFGLSLNQNAEKMEINHLFSSQDTRDNTVRSVLKNYLLREVNGEVHDIKYILKNYQNFSSIEINSSDSISVSLTNPAPVKSIKAYYVDSADLKQKEIAISLSKYGNEVQISGYSWKFYDMRQLLKRWSWYYKNIVNFKVEIPYREINGLTLLKVNNEIVGLPMEIVEKPLSGTIEVNGVGVWL